MTQPLARVLLLSALVAAPTAASAAPILSTSAGSFGTAQSLNGFFSLGLNADIVNSTTIPHVEVSQAGRPSFGYDFYSFSTIGGIVHLDIDIATFDTEIGIWDAAGNLLAENDNNAFDPGDSSGVNSGIFFLNLAAGTYVVGVSAFNSFHQTGAPYITGSGIPQSHIYTLNVSAVPEPITSSLVGLGIAALVGRGYCLSRRS